MGDTQTSDLEVVPTKTEQVPDAQNYSKNMMVEVVDLTRRAEEACKEVKTPEQYEVVCKIGGEAQAKLKVIDKVMEDKIVSPARMVWKNSLALKNDLCEPLKRIKTKAGKSATTWRLEEERKVREAEEARLAEIARQEEERAEQERARLAEIQRRADEAAAAEAKRQEDIRKAQEKAAAEEEDARLRQAEAAEAAGAKPERIDSILETSMPQAAVELPKPVPKPAPVPELPPAPPPPPPVEPVEVPKVSNAVSKTLYEARVEKPFVLLRAIVEGELPEDIRWQDIVEIKQGALNRIAQKQKDRFRIPGVKAVPVAGTTFRS